MKTVLTIIGVVILVIYAAFLYLVIAGADESRKHHDKLEDGGINK